MSDAVISSAFTLLQPRYAKLLADENSLNAVIIAQALNNGNLNMAILYGGVDGQKFEVARPTLKARRSKKYFKKGKEVVAYTLLVNHIPLQTELIGAHEHESYFAFDICYNNTSSIMPTAITGDMHLINKANFAMMEKSSYPAEGIVKLRSVISVGD